MTGFVVSVLLLLTAVTAAASMYIRNSSADVFPLDMAEDSVDDCYKNCKPAMKKLVLSKYMKHEISNTLGFKNAWSNSLNKCSELLPRFFSKLNKNQCAAIYLYTQDCITNENCSYKKFNKATRIGKAEYQSGNFKFYTLFFFLTDAVQKLKPKISCLTTYRRTKDTYPTDVVNKTIRFGSFTSTSLYMNSTNYGNKSCFKIKTCYGAKISKYSKFPHENEVLIPPYEVFRITSVQENTWCDVVYELKSEKIRSDLNCAKIRKNKTKGDPNLSMSNSLLG